MKRNQKILSVLVILGLLGAMSLAACGPKSGTVVYGKVTVVNKDTVTIAVGTLELPTDNTMDIPSGAGNGRQRTTSGETPGGRYPGNVSGMPSDGSFTRPDMMSGFDPAAVNPGGRPNNGSGTTSGFDGRNFPQGGILDLSTLLTLTGVTKFVTITDTQTITKVGIQAVMASSAAASQAGTPGTLADITVGSILRITYQNGSDKIQSIEIIESPQLGVVKPGAVQSGASSKSTASSST